MIFHYTFPAFVDDIAIVISIYVEAEKCPSPNEMLELLKSSSGAFKWMHGGETNKYEKCLKAFDGLCGVFPQLSGSETYKSIKCKVSPELNPQYGQWYVYDISVELIDILKI